MKKDFIQLKRIHFTRYNNLIISQEKFCEMKRCNRKTLQLITHHHIHNLSNTVWPNIFQGLDWEKLENKEVKPPFKPLISDDLDTRNFAEEFTEMSATYSPAPTPAITPKAFKVKPEDEVLYYCKSYFCMEKLLSF